MTVTGYEETYYFVEYEQPTDTWYMIGGTFNTEEDAVAYLTTQAVNQLVANGHPVQRFRVVLQVTSKQFAYFTRDQVLARAKPLL